LPAATSTPLACAKAQNLHVASPCGCIGRMRCRNDFSGNAARRFCRVVEKSGYSLGPPSLFELWRARPPSLFELSPASVGLSRTRWRAPDELRLRRARADVGHGDCTAELLQSQRKKIQAERKASRRATDGTASASPTRSGPRKRGTPNEDPESRRTRGGLRRSGSAG
jgi:hypothetical protein